MTHERASPIRQKSPAELNAQALAFAEGNQSGHERGRIFAAAQQEVGKLAMDESYQQYVSFLRQHRKAGHETIDKRTELQARYDEFEPVVTGLLRELEDVKRISGSKQVHEAFLGAGTQANVFLFEKDGEEYVARTLKTHDPVLLDTYVNGTLDVQGVPHFEQGVAVSYEDGAMISERMPGASLAKVTTEDIKNIRPEQLSELVGSIKIAHDKSIRLDAVPANFMYDKEAGFGLIDLESERGSVQLTTFGRKLEQVVYMLARIGDDESGRYEHGMKREYYTSLEDLMAGRIEVLSAFRTVVEQDVTDEKVRDAVIYRINMCMFEVEGLKDHYSDPVKVAEMMRDATPKYVQPPQVTLDTVAPAEKKKWEVPTAPMAF